nr:class I SAM-dependent methyltransferase [Singulisphaera sp. GP187]
MKGRESGMPDEDFWGTFFDPLCILEKLGCAESRRGLVEFGCGFGHFTVPAAQLARGEVFAIDIDPAMVATTIEKVQSAGLTNVTVEQRDFVEAGCGRPDTSTDHVMLFNILQSKTRPSCYPRLIAS